jgi:general stress protein 26
MVDTQRKLIRRAIARHSFCTLATASAANRPLVTGVLYSSVDQHVYVSSLTSSVKVRNVRENARVALCIPVRRYPVGPPFTVQFQGLAEVLAVDEPEVTQLVASRRLKRITSHGELAHPDACVLRITPGPTVATYGLGVGLRELLRQPLTANRTVQMREADGSR